MELPMTRRVAHQALGYAAFFVLVYLFPTTSRIMSTVGDPPSFPIRFLAVSSVGSQGWWNWMIYYLLPKVLDDSNARSRSDRTHSRRRSGAVASGESHYASDKLVHSRNEEQLAHPDNIENADEIDNKVVLEVEAPASLSSDDDTPVAQVDISDVPP